MEESGLLRERLHAITEKHRIQEDIRKKKQELDQEKLKLQHLKKKSLREQWLLQDSTSHNAPDRAQQQRLLSDQQRTRVLQLNIHRIEREVESLEREESRISTNESFILNRLKAVERSPEEIIKEAQDSFLHEPTPVDAVTPDIPGPSAPAADAHAGPSTPRKTLFAMEINVSKNLLTGERTVLSTASVAPEDLGQHAGLKVYDDGRKCVYALNSGEGSRDRSCASELSAVEVEQLLRSAAEHRQGTHQSYPQGRGRREERCFYGLQDESGGGGGGACRPRGLGELPPASATVDKYSNCREDWQRKPLDWHRHRGRQEGRLSKEDRSIHCCPAGSHHRGNQLLHHTERHTDYHLGSYEAGDRGDRRSGSAIGSGGGMNGGGANACPLLRSYDQEEVSRYQPQLCYTPANDIPLSDYLSVDKGGLYSCRSPPAALHGGPARSDRAPSPLYGDDAPYTILSTLDTAEPVTAIFMGFQTAEDHGGHGHEFEGSLRAQLVVIEDGEESGKSAAERKTGHHQRDPRGHPAGTSANGNAEGQRRVGPDGEGPSA